ncbi:MAG: 50S ribosomal protein L4 [Patescibacteria group bacterium]|nr:50S ribosomal protein L4 [Patescibacteria group bacterium]
MPINKIKDQSAKLKTKVQSSKPRTGGTVKTVRSSALKTAKKPAVQRVSGLQIEVFDIKGKVVKKISLSKEIFGVKVNRQLLSQAVRVYLANQREGTASTKTRGEVRGSTRKIYKQKGTGRARHGAIRAPIFVHGGIVFGPKPRDYSLKLTKKMRKAALSSALSLMYKNNEIKILSGLGGIKPKTKEIAGVIKNLGLDTKKTDTILILPGKVENVYRAARNIEGLDITYANQLNAYEILASKMLLLMDESMPVIEKHFER